MSRATRAHCRCRQNTGDHIHSYVCIHIIHTYVFGHIVVRPYGVRVYGIRLYGIRGFIFRAFGTHPTVSQLKVTISFLNNSPMRLPIGMILRLFERTFYEIFLTAK